MKRCKTGSILKSLASLVLATTALATGPAHAEDLYVAESATSSGNGSVASPYWRITDAVVRARSDRQNAAIPAAETIVIHVAPGTYLGTYGSLGSNKQMEVLPITLNMPNVVLSGATVLALDGSGLPTGVMPGTQQTILTTNDVLNPIAGFKFSQTLIAIVSTTDGGNGNHVTVTGFTLDQPNVPHLGSNIVPEHVSGFVILGNLMRHADSVFARSSSGTLEGNLTEETFGTGAYMSGGSANYPAHVTVLRNRMIHGEHGLMIGAGLEHVSLDLGHNNLTPVPVQSSGSNGTVSTGITATITGNDLSQNNFAGLRFAVSPINSNSTEGSPSPGLPILSATVSSNTMLGNAEYGVLVDGGDNCSGNKNLIFSATFQGTFAGNQILGNGRGPAFFTFTEFGVGLDQHMSSCLYLQQALYDVTDLDGELAGFDYDNPVTDPNTGAVLNNTLMVNGAVTPTGRKITPLP